MFSQNIRMHLAHSIVDAAFLSALSVFAVGMATSLDTFDMVLGTMLFVSIGLAIVLQFFWVGVILFVRMHFGKGANLNKEPKPFGRMEYLKIVMTVLVILALILSIIEAAETA